MWKWLALTIGLAMMAYAPTGYAACSSSDFTVENFDLDIDTRRDMVNMSGELVNQCDEPAAARIEIEAFNGSGSALETVDGWPARRDNIEPGDRVEFDFSGMMRFDRSMEDFSVSIVESRQW